jgi:phospholipid/cholesterol/gamma-HCH transport system substrate-binding protein
MSDATKRPAARRRARELWVGALVLVAAAAVLTMAFVFGGAAVLRDEIALHARVDGIEGLRVGAPVEVRGVRVGRVTAISLVTGGVDVQLRVARDADLRSDARMNVQRDLLGAARVDIAPGVAEARLVAGATLPATASLGIASHGQDIATRSKALVDRASALMSPAMVEDVHASAAALRALLESTNDTVARLDRVGATLQRTAEAAGALVGKIDDGDGAIGKLVHDPSLYRNLDTAAREITRAATEIGALVRDIRREPGRFVNIDLF